MNHDSDKTYKLPDWPEETEKPAETPRPRRRKRHVPEEPSDFWGKLRFRTGKKLRWFGRRAAASSGRPRRSVFRNPTVRRCNFC